MPWLKRWHLEAFAIVAGVGTLIAMGVHLVGMRGLLLANGLPLFGDFMAFWSAGRLALEGRVAEVHDHVAAMAMHRSTIPEMKHWFPWRSPPVFLLVAAPLALLPYAAAALVFIGLSFAIYLAGMRMLAPDRRALIFAAAAPSALLQIGSAQLGLWITGFTALAAHWLEKRPIAAGAAIALLSVKPHLAILWPLMLALQGRWRTFLAAAAFALALVALAGFVFGFESYARFLTDLGAAQDLNTRRGLPPNTLASVYANLLALGALPGWAMAVHLLSAALALGACLFVWRRDSGDASIAALAGGTLLMSPYLFFYDTLLLAVGVAALAQQERAWPALCVYALAFGAGSLTLWIGYQIVLPFCPLAAWSMLALACANVMRRENAAPLPA